MAIQQRVFSDVQIRAEGESADEDGFRTIKAVISTSDPYKKWSDGYETLLHGAGNVDTSRMDNLPILWQHQRDNPIGMVTGWERFDDRIEVEAKIGGCAKGDDVVRMLDNNLLHKMSVGYDYNWRDTETEELANEDEWNVNVVRWEIYEASIVSCPADNNAEIQSVREARDGVMPAPAATTQPDPDTAPDEGENPDTEITKAEDTETMTEPTVDNTADILEQERSRSAVLSKLARKNDIDSETEQRWIAEGTDSGTAALEVVDILNARKVEADKAKAKASDDDDDTETRKVNAPAVHAKTHTYDIRKAIFAENADDIDGVEREAHDKLNDARSEKNKAEGVLVPANELARTAYRHRRKSLDPITRAAKDQLYFGGGERAIQGATGEEAAGLIDDVFRTDLLIDILRDGDALADPALSAVNYISGVSDEQKLPRTTANQGFVAIDPDATAVLAETSAASWGSVTATLHSGMARVIASRRANLLGGRGNMDLLSYWISNVMDGASEFIADQFFNGSGTGNNATGLTATTGILGSTGRPDALDRAGVTAVHGQLYGSNAVTSASKPVWVFSGVDYSDLEGTLVDAGSGRMLIDDDMMFGKVPAMFTNHLAHGATGVAYCFVPKWSNVILFETGIETRFTTEAGISGVAWDVFIDYDILHTQGTAIVKRSA